MIDKIFITYPKPASLKNIDYKKGLVINLLKEKERDEKELMGILDDLKQDEMLYILNDLIESNLIDINEKNKYYLIE